jgi:hypothetical protein
LPWQHGVQFEMCKRRSERGAFLFCGIIHTMLTGSQKEWLLLPLIPMSILKR